MCGSRKWRRGVCEEGHLRTRLVETNESQQASQYSVTTRRQRKNSRRRVRAAANDYYHGERAVFLLWQIMQKLLRDQLAIMIGQLGYPPALEGVCRELWAMLVCSCNVPNAPRKFHQRREDASSFSGPKEGGVRRLGVRRRNASDASTGDEASPAPVDTTSESEDEEERFKREQSSDDEDDLEDDMRGIKKRAESKETWRDTFTVQDGSDPGDSKKPARDVKPSRRRPPLPRKRGPTKRRRRDPRHRLNVRDAGRLDYTLLVLYLACLTLKIPVYLRDILQCVTFDKTAFSLADLDNPNRLAEDYTIPFLNVRRTLPASIRAHMGDNVRATLNVQVRPPRQV